MICSLPLNVLNLKGGRAQKRPVHRRICVSYRDDSSLQQYQRSTHGRTGIPPPDWLRNAIRSRLGPVPGSDFSQQIEYEMELTQGATIHDRCPCFRRSQRIPRSKATTNLKSPIREPKTHLRSPQ